MQPQRYENHRQFNRLHHGVLTPIAAITFVLSVIMLTQVWRAGGSIMMALVVFLLAFMALLASVTSRQSALLVQDRAIYTAENLRHFMLTGKPLDHRLTLRQVIALRFASDEEFVNLAATAADTGLKPKEIKQAVQRWRPDERRV